MSCEAILKELADELGGSETIRRICRVLPFFARHATPMVITGEPGTGKLEIAKAVWRLRNEPVSDDGNATSSLPLALENVPAERSAVEFTRIGDPDSSRWNPEIFPESGILYLERADTVPISWQRALLERSCATDSRIQVIATLETGDPYGCIESGTLDETFFHHLNTCRFHLSPLRERPADILTTTTRFLERVNRVHRAQFTEVPPDTAEFLTSYDWPGNRIELWAVLVRAAILAEMDGGRASLSPDLLPPVVRGELPEENPSMRFRARMTFAEMVTETVKRALTELGEDSGQLCERVLDPFEKELIRQVFEQTRRVRIRTAERLGINRNTLHRKMVDYAIDENEQTLE
ncbi:MAG: helix-turn-helix domain-containing protein [Planctomycetia bacterium]|nr:helix-turn-helix domain-containing protein [Planctomycetia bacterium]